MNISATFIHQYFVADNYDVNKYQLVVRLVQKLHDNIATIVSKDIIDGGLLYLVLCSHTYAATNLGINTILYFDPVPYT